MDAYIDPATIVVINLDHCVDTLEAFRRRNAHLGPVRRFPAVAGAVLDRAELQDRGVIAGDIDYSDGALGCALSHVALWQEIACGTRMVTVCEDDAVFAGDFVATANARLAALADGWDIVLWGWNFDSWLVFQVLPGRPACLVHGTGSVTDADLGAASHASASPQLFRLDRACGTLCYTISPNGAARMLAHCRPLRPLPIFLPELRVNVANSGIDLMMSTAYSQMRAYVSVPPLAISPNLNADSTTLGLDAAGLRRKVGRLPLETLVGALDQDDMGTDPCTKAAFYKAWIDANSASAVLFAAWFNLGGEFVRSDDHSSAIIAYQNVLVLKPDFGPALTALGLLLRGSAGMGRVQGA
jgi:glycosyl transferase, family 25